MNVPFEKVVHPRFVVLAVSRSGSNMLCTLLDSHPQVLCHHEIFNPKGVRLAVRLRESGFDLGTLAEREMDPLAFLDRVWQRDLGHPCVGFKMTYRQNECVYRRLMSDAGIAKIVLRRRNRLKTYVSSLVAEQLGQWEVYRAEDLASARPRVLVDPSRFFAQVAYNDVFYAELFDALDAAGQAWIHVDYEALERHETQQALLTFLGVATSHALFSGASLKQNPRDLRLLVANYAELKRALAGTVHEAELASLDD